MTRKEYEKFYREFNKKYDRFKKNNLPTSFWDEERQTLEYVYFDSDLDRFMKKLQEETENFDYKLHVDNSLVSALENITNTGFYYSFSSKYHTTKRGEDGKLVFTLECGHSHAHSFEDVVEHLYKYPESFSISKEEEVYYSKQELKYLRRVQKYLLFIGLKDLDEFKPKVSRFRNKLHKKYCTANTFEFTSKQIEEFKNGVIDFTIRKSCNGDYIEEQYKKGDYRALFVDEGNDYKLFVEFTHRETKKYEKIKEKVSSNKFKDEDLLVLTYFKILEEF